MSTTDNAPLTIRDMIEPAIKAAGGWVNTHAHADRAYTLSPDVLEMRRTCTLQQKWDALDRLKRESTEEDFYRRFSLFFENQISQGVTALATFVDIDPMSEDRAIKAGMRAREHYKDQLTVKFANQTLKGVINPEARKWFDIGAELVDIIGALPKRDERDYGKGAEAFDIILGTAKRLGKMVHVHVDQFNESLEYETEQLCEKTIEHDMVGRVDRRALQGLPPAPLRAHEEGRRHDDRLPDRLDRHAALRGARPDAQLHDPGRRARPRGHHGRARHGQRLRRHGALERRRHVARDDHARHGLPL